VAPASAVPQLEQKRPVAGAPHDGQRETAASGAGAPEEDGAGGMGAVIASKVHGDDSLVHRMRSTARHHSARIARCDGRDSALVVAARAGDLGDGLFVAGDHRDTASLQGAMVSGRRAARAVLRGIGLAAPSEGWAHDGGGVNAMDCACAAYGARPG